LSEEISRAVGTAVVFSAVLFKLRIPGFGHPAAKMLARNVGQSPNPVFALVEAGQQVEFLASRAEEEPSALDADFFEGLQAIRHESRTDHIDAAHAVPAAVGQDGRGIGLYPFRPPKAGLKGDLPVALGKLESIGEEARGLVTLVMVGIPAGKRKVRQAVEAHDQLIGPARLPPALLHEARKRSDISGVIVKVLHQPDFRHFACLPYKLRD